MNAAIDISPNDLRTVRKILRDLLPEHTRVFVFGSRASWTTREGSDLDLAVESSGPLSRVDLALLSEAFENSDIPYKVDVVDVTAINSSFRETIASKLVPLPGWSTDVAEGWRERRLGDVIELKRGYDLPKSERKPGPIPLISSSGVTDHIDCAKLAGPGVVTGRYGTIGQVFYIDEPFWPLNTTLYVRDFKGNDPQFISYLLGQLDFKAFSDKAAVPGVNRNHLHEAIVSLPADAIEQRTIASILSSLDHKITLNRRMNESLEAMARALFRDWFIDFGPVYAKAARARPYLSSEIWDLFPACTDDDSKPEGWSYETVLEQAEWVNGAAYKDMHFSTIPEAWPVVKIAELKNGITQQTKFTNSNLGDRYNISDGEVLFSWSGNPETSIDTFIWTGGDAWLNQHIFAVRDNGHRGKAYLYFMLKYLRSEFAAIARDKQTTGLGHVTKADMRRMCVCVGPPKVMDVFESTVQPLFEALYRNLRESRTLALTRDLLLPRLASGEIRVRDVEKLAETVL